MKAFSKVILTAGQQLMSVDINQAFHGFSTGSWLKLSGASTYALAKADVPANAEVIGVVSAVIDANNFTITEGGYITGLSGLTPNSTYFLSPTTAGVITATEPTTVGQVSKPLLVADTTTSGYFFNFRGMVIPSASTPSSIGLGNVTNDAQTKAAIVPNTLPAAGQLLVGNAGGTAYAPVAASGDATVAPTGAFTLGNTAVTPGFYSSAEITIDSKGRITAANSGFYINVLNYGAIPAKVISDAAIASGSNVLTSATANFTSANVGDRIYVGGAIAGTYGNLMYGATVHSVTNSTTVVLYDDVNVSPKNATHTVSGANCAFGKDNSAAFNAAYIAANALGKRVLTPKGIWIITTYLPNMPANVVVEGCLDFNNFNGETGYTSDGTAGALDVWGGGSQIWITSGQRGGSISTIRATHNCKFTGIAIYHPDEIQDVTPAAYPFDFQLSGNNVVIEKVCFLNSYNAIWIDRSNTVILRTIRGQALNYGVFVDGGLDQPILEDVRWVPNWSAIGVAFDWSKTTGIGFLVFRADAIRLKNCFVLLMNWGLQLDQGTVDWGGGVKNSDGICTACEFDTCWSGSVNVRSTKRDSCWNLNGCTFGATGIVGSTADILDSTDPTASPPRFHGNINISGSTFRQGKNVLINLIGHAHSTTYGDALNSTGAVLLSGCTFYDYLQYAIVVGSNNRVTVAGCDFACFGDGDVAVNGPSSSHTCVFTANGTGIAVVTGCIGRGGVTFAKGGYSAVGVGGVLDSNNVGY